VTNTGVDDHLARILSVVAPLSALEMVLADAHGCVLAADVHTAAPLPPFDNSATDGYAVRAADLAGSSPQRPGVLTVSGELSAGAEPAVRVAPGFCVRIMTGAMIPAGADAVVPADWTDRGNPQVRFAAAPHPGQGIRRAGEDLAAGALVLPAGTHLGAAQIGLLASAGHARVPVRPRPRVVVFSTGDELREPADPLGPGQIPDSNSYALAAAAREAGAVAYRVGAVSEDPARLRDTLDDHIIRADAVVTSGGVSAGNREAVTALLDRMGSVSFDRVAMQPGVPQGFGTLGPDAVPIFALPGNPVSALVSFEVFVRPALRRMLGAEPLLRPQLQATWGGPAWSSPAGRRQFVQVDLGRAADGGYAVVPVGGAGSHLLSGMALANALAIVPEAVTEVAPGQRLAVMLLERRGR
jgi:molybdopterin molybdotransferase